MSDLLHTCLYGDPRLNSDDNRKILEAFISYMINSKRTITRKNIVEEFLVTPVILS